MDPLPLYFKEYMEEKFTELHTKLDDYNTSHTKDFEEVRNEMLIVERIAKNADTKVNYWSGGIAVLVCIGLVVGGVLAAHFKKLNGVQVTASVSDALTPVQTDISELRGDVVDLRLDVANLKSHIFDYKFEPQQ